MLTRLSMVIWGLLVLFCYPAISEGDVYRWQDPQGVVHYTDDINQIPPHFRKQAETVNLPEPTSRPVPLVRDTALEKTENEEDINSGQTVNEDQEDIETPQKGPSEKEKLKAQLKKDEEALANAKKRYYRIKRNKERRMVLQEMKDLRKSIAEANAKLYQ